MGMANWFVGKMVDAFLKQPAEEKAAIFDTMASKFWAAATPEDIARISELLLPRFLESFLDSASAEQKVELATAFLGGDQVQSTMKEMLPTLVGEALKKMSPDEWKALLPTPLSGMPGMPGMPGAKPGASSPPRKKQPPTSPGNMMPW